MRDQDLKAFSKEVKKGFVEALGNKSYFSSPKRIKDLVVGQKFQMEGLDMNGNTVQADATLIAYNGMNKYVVESDGITILYDGEDVVTKVNK